MVRDVSYEESLLLTLRDPIEAAAYLAEVIAMQDQPALMLALRHVQARFRKSSYIRPYIVGGNENANP
jgi:DNA-binding phage protein